MDGLLKEQKLAVEKLNKIISNFGKDSIGRKNEDYYEKRISDLTNWYEEFKENHDQLEEFDLENEPYSKEQTFKKAIDAYKAHLKKLRDGLAAIKKNNDNNDESEDENGKGATGAQEDSDTTLLKLVYNNLAEMVQLIEKQENQPSPGVIRAQLEVAKNTFEIFHQSTWLNL